MNYLKINRFWQSFILFIAPIILTLLIIFRNGMTPWMWLLCLHLPFLMFHEAEEYVLSPVSFKDFFNLKSIFGSGNNSDIPLDDGYVFQVNILIAWPLVILGALLANVAPWIGLSMIWFEIILNNVMHTMFFQSQGKKPSYNPGMLTNCLILVPYSVVVIVAAAGLLHWWDWVLSVVLGGGVCFLLARKTSKRLKLAKTSSK